MGWAVGYDTNWKRDIGYGVPAICDYPNCGAHIDRGLSYVCGNEQPYGGEHGCGLFFCNNHMHYTRDRGILCPRCSRNKPPYDPTPDTIEWMRWKLRDLSWKEWRDEHPKEVAAMLNAIKLSASVPSPAAPKATPS